jgi:hypothetical protein
MPGDRRARAGAHVVAVRARAPVAGRQPNRARADVRDALGYEFAIRSMAAAAIMPSATTADKQRLDAGEERDS